MYNTKACNLTEDEIKILIIKHGTSLSYSENRDDIIERINYLNKRLKADGKKQQDPLEGAASLTPSSQEQPSNLNQNIGWGPNSNG